MIHFRHCNRKTLPLPATCIDTQCLICRLLLSVVIVEHYCDVTDGRTCGRFLSCFLFVCWLVGWLVSICMGGGGGFVVVLLLFLFFVFCCCFFVLFFVFLFLGFLLFWLFLLLRVVLPCRCVCDLFGAFTSNALVGEVWMGR